MVTSWRLLLVPNASPGPSLGRAHVPRAMLCEFPSWAPRLAPGAAPSLISFLWLLRHLPFLVVFVVVLLPSSSSSPPSPLSPLPFPPPPPPPPPPSSSSSSSSSFSFSFSSSWTSPMAPGGRAWWDIFPTSNEREGVAEQNPAGKVKLEAKLYRLSHEKASLTRPSSKLTPSSAYMTIHVRALRGLRDRACSGAALNVTVEGTTPRSISLKSKKSRKVKLPACTVEAQRMLEFLVLEKGHSISRAAEISGIPVETVRSALQARASFTCEWFRGLGFAFEDPSTSTVSIQMTTEPEAKELKAGKKLKLAELSVPFRVGDLIEMP
ncbi:unnamed protein product, partial [Prorocentrum cordatum]